jgi:hypothetical protein
MTKLPGRTRLAAVLAAMALAAPAVRADVTIRYKNEVKTGALPSPGMAGKLPLSRDTVLRLKGSKGYSSDGNVTSVMDFDKQEITFIDAANKKFATMPLKDMTAQLGAAIPDIPAEARTMMESIKATVSSRKTGQTDTIQGVQAEETELNIQIEMQSGPMMKMVMHLWRAKPDEAFRVPAVRQWTGYSMYANRLMNPSAEIQKLFAKLPGMAQTLAPVQEELSKNQFMLLKSHTEMFMPMLTATAANPNGPAFEMTSEVVEISSAPVDDSVFQIPTGYDVVPTADIMKSTITAPRP